MDVVDIACSLVGAAARGVGGPTGWTGVRLASGASGVVG
jgi:hypothetical protein